jgi:hypothetical protein
VRIRQDPANGVQVESAPQQFPAQHRRVTVDQNSGVIRAADDVDARCQRDFAIADQNPVRP